MYNFRDITIGYIPTRRDTFPNPIHAAAQRDPVRRQFEAMAAKCGHVRLVDMDWLNEEKMLVHNADLPLLIQKLQTEQVDALCIVLCNFGQEEVIAKLAKAINKPVLLWGPRDPMPPTDCRLDRQTDTQCGLFAASRALQRYGVPFTYIENCWLDAPVLAEGFEHFVRTVSVVKAMTQLRIGQISTRPWQFLSVKANESELLERFGVEVVPFNEAQLMARIRALLAEPEGRLADRVADLHKKVKFIDMPEEKVKTIAAFELAVTDLAEIHDCRAFASECWDVLPKELGIRPCFAFGDLTDRGLPVACETDIHGAITSVLLTAAARGETPNFLADVTIRHPENDNAELLWHCGPFPVSLIKGGEEPTVVGCHGQWEIKGGEITIARFDAHRGEYKLFAGCAVGVDGPKTNGNYVWVETKDWPAWEKQLIYGPYIHHVAGIHGNYMAVLREACKYLNGVIFDPAV